MEKLLKGKKLSEDELRKIKDLLKNDEKSDKKIDWMYSDGKPKSEEYLLGKRIDNIDKEKEEAKNDSVGALFEEAAAHNIQIDMQAKMREDPLFAIRKKEEEQRKRIIENPVKMKQLQKMVESQKKDKKKKKKEKKKKKHKSRSGSDTSESDDDLVSTYLDILNRKEKIKSDNRHKNDSKDKRKPQHEGGPKVSEQRKKHSEEDTRQRHRDGYSTEEEMSGRGKNYGLFKGRHKSPDKERHKKELHSRKDRKSRSRSPVRTSGRSPKRKRSRSPVRRERSRSRSPVRKGKPRSPEKREAPRKKLSSDELERRRKEMMENAQWREEQRSKNVKRYREEEKKEEETRIKHGDGDNFLNPMMTKHAEQSSVEDRLKRNRYNIQRTRADLDKDFTKQ
ncbi:pre-mRNA-splicing factor CWC25 homolog isoform X2 [Lingula anatina]|uniref:Pre-mRNA-splicing factor CWC25 homolog isoform X1 n=1 Tax=Lingula anatina TaxID=7574 RepID=A0A1S3ITT2_LINAN|nr:pre-mRNA-splicing factor CWC25 homolog isoform X1 [Lingula anatina]XP_013401605.1 pre-mRNA-splicing factor CWC25 homolog isoform X1 [Lingula anatina]XP_013401606.1 pre-mRNA-splicing factor CWC25 homolog isoform X1 [Lingula anatina]XP_013401607.1 pre-mRNA-splicing factor CWC25 homolog isoform X1 [Lingula anatina]XP_013401608.1 pre-mRNA-splicing factor CWC25 homolog isoform X2 [Lingula anatina]XP_013401609.1 pre-mRNA-splicing factor CWC25 homolog isoform X2 [Lingula anatina]XP_013401610.1 pr|eukprot:XP_013401604.1 pre-mRNA-splicing factor CWC25 homolog isoform X1 [Lingula anatina]